MVWFNARRSFVISSSQPAATVNSLQSYLSDILVRPIRHIIEHFGDDGLMTQPAVSSIEGGWLVIQTGLSLTRLTSPCHNNTWPRIQHSKKARRVNPVT